jgi:hypothetical protein
VGVEYTLPVVIAPTRGADVDSHRLVRPCRVAF